MPIQIQNHTDGTLAGVTPEHQIKSRSESHELQHHVSWLSEEAYQAISVDTGITAATQTLLHVKNTSATKNLVVSFIRFQAITDTANKPVVGEYFEMGFGRTVDAGGTPAIPVNMNTLSGKVAEATVTGVDPTMAGTFVPIDRWYNENNNEHKYDKHGSIVLGLNDTFEIRLVSAGAGEAVCRVTFMMLDKNR